MAGRMENGSQSRGAVMVGRHYCKGRSSARQYRFTGRNACLHHLVPLIVKSLCNVVHTSAIFGEILVIDDVSTHHTIHIPGKPGGKLQAQYCKQTYGE